MAHGVAPQLIEVETRAFPACVRVPAHPTTGTFLLLDLPSVGQRCSDTNPHSHEDSWQTCVHRGLCKGCVFCPKLHDFPQLTALTPHPRHTGIPP